MTELAERILELHTPQIWDESLVGVSRRHVLLQAPPEFDDAHLAGDSLTDVWTEGLLTLPCACEHPEYHWVVDIDHVIAFPDWLLATAMERSWRRNAMRERFLQLKSSKDGSSSGVKYLNVHGQA
jgi:hypothetical protein